MASPHVAGAIALLLQAEAGQERSSDYIVDTLLAWTTADVVSNPGRNSPNKMLFLPYGDESAPEPDPEEPPETDPEDPVPDEPATKPLGARARRRHTRITLTLHYDNSPMETRPERWLCPQNVLSSTHPKGTEAKGLKLRKARPVNPASYGHPHRRDTDVIPTFYRQGSLRDFRALT